jgi:mannose-1-phosphate guanylyltransferase/mannose-6-phosphate isomerase
MIQVTPVILCGGSGARLWPLSRIGFPKQFLCLTGDYSLFQQAVQRLAGLGNNTNRVAAPLVVAGEDHRFLIAEQLREIGITLGCALLEPVSRNTAPALTLAALAAIENGEDPVLVVTPADQIADDSAAFIAAIQEAIEQANKGNIIILGVTPKSPETGYGYIQADVGCATAVQNGIYIVKRFVEKPDAVTVRQYLLQGGYFWNAGIFVLKASVWLKAIEMFRPDIYMGVSQAWVQRSRDVNPSTPFIRPGKAEFTATPAESVDYAVMEQCLGSAFTLQMVPLDAGWSDLGSWEAVWNVLPKDEHRNAYVGDVLATDCHNTLVHASSRLVSLVGVSGLIVVETPDAILVANKDRGQDVKQIVAQLQSTHREEQIVHRKVHRPWGWYDSVVDDGDCFKVKRIQVKPGASISLQKHFHRAEHWIVVKGVAEITIGDKVMLLTKNQSTFIPLGVVHRLANPGEIPLEIIEVQSGTYLGEDDIIRFEDTYGRTGA